MRRLNIGCGSVQPEGWDNADLDDHGQEWWVDVRVNRWHHREGGLLGPEWSMFDDEPCPAPGPFDYIVANHLLSCFSHHELIEKVLPNLHALLKDGGVLRVLVPDAKKAAEALLAGDRSWFPQGDDLPTVDEAFCTYLPWFGESKSIFTRRYLASVLFTAGFSPVDYVRCGESATGFGGPDGIASLDDRCGMSLIVDARKSINGWPPRSAR